MTTTANIISITIIVTPHRTGYLKYLGRVSQPARRDLCLLTDDGLV